MTHRNRQIHFERWGGQQWRPCKTINRGEIVAEAVFTQNCAWRNDKLHSRRTKLLAEKGIEPEERLRRGLQNMFPEIRMNVLFIPKNRLPIAIRRQDVILTKDENNQGGHHD